MAHAGTALLDPHTIFEYAQLQPHMHVADLGCGKTGHIVFPAAKALNEHGVVYAVDIVKSALDALRNRAEALHLSDIRPVWGDIERERGIAIPEGTLDVAFFINVLNHVNVDAALTEVTRILKEKGRIVVVDWVRNVGGLGAHGRLLDFSSIEEWARSSGFLVQHKRPLGDYHMIMVLYRHT